MSIRKSTTLELTREGYAAALALEPNALLLEFIEFRVAKDSQPLASGAWGTEVFRGRVSDFEVGEIAAAAARDADLLGELFGVVDDQHAAPALAGLGGAHHAGCAGAYHDDVEVVGLGRMVHDGPGCWRGRGG